ncbi:MAG TPA: hypothetical protein ENK85_05350 [Saprospiraceae bacterium]|nr:hypothetical protein [Saprospiraceae bacterium]
MSAKVREKKHFRYGLWGAFGLCGAFGLWGAPSSLLVFGAQQAAFGLWRSNAAFVHTGSLFWWAQ